MSLRGMRNMKKGAKGYFKSKTIMIPKRRSVENDYKYFDPPRIIWEKINTNHWPYKTNRDLYWLRDLSFMCLLYMTCARVSELCRFKRDHIFAPSITKDQFVRIGDFLAIRNLRIIKRKKIVDLSDYPSRQEIYLPLKGELSIFTKPILKYLDKLTSNEELFKFRNVRGYQIVTYCTDGEFPHYLRDMGLKMWLRLYGLNVLQLKEFSGHKRLENLIRYLREAESEETMRKMLTIKLEDFEPKEIPEK